MDCKELLKLRQRSDGLNRYMNIQILDISEGAAVAELDLTPEMLNPLGVAHGGSIFTLCDAAAGSAAASRGRLAVTLSGVINYLRPGKASETLRAEASELKAGKSTSVYSVDVYDTAGTLVSNSTFTMFYTGQRAEDVWGAQ